MPALKSSTCSRSCGGTPTRRRSSPTRSRTTKNFGGKRAEVEPLQKNNGDSAERLKELQKPFRQHARDEKRELLPAVQKALSEEQVQGIVEKMQTTLAEADQAR